MTTNEEFQEAIEMIINCKATMNCGCEYDDILADALYYQCKYFIDSYKRKKRKRSKEEQDLKSRSF